MQKSTQQIALETYIELISGYIPELFRYIDFLALQHGILFLILVSRL